MKAIKYVFDNKHAVEGNMRTVVELPDDLVVTPIKGDYQTFHEESDRVKVCHSETKKRWYILIEIKPSPNEPDVFDQILEEGNFSYAMRLMDLGIGEAPFKWGVPLQSIKYKNVQYLPIWETVPSGHYNEDDFELYTHAYKLITLRNPPCEAVIDNVIQYNYMTSFEVEDFDTVKGLVLALEHRTGKRF